MKIIARQLAVLLSAALFTLGLHAQGYLVPDGVTYAGGGTSFGGIIHVVQNPTNGDFSGFTFPPQGPQSFQFNPFLDESVRVFFVSGNDPITIDTIQAQAYAELTYPNAYFFQNAQSFYIGLFTGYSPVNGIYANPVFGWAEIYNNNGVVELVDGALAYGAAGIYAGTQNIIQIPEPGGFSLGLVGWAFLVLRRRLKRETRH